MFNRIYVLSVPAVWYPHLWIHNVKLLALKCNENGTGNEQYESYEYNKSVYNTLEKTNKSCDNCFQHYLSGTIKDDKEKFSTMNEQCRSKNIFLNRGNSMLYRRYTNISSAT